MPLERFVLFDATTPDEDMLSRIFTTVTATGRVLADLALMVFVSVFFAFSPSLYREGIVRLLPKASQQPTRKVLMALGSSLRAWLLARPHGHDGGRVIVTVGLSLLEEGVWRRLQAAETKIVHEPREQPWGRRVFRVYDPDGRIVELGEPMWAVVARFLSQGMSLEGVASRTAMPLELVEQIAQLP